MHIPLIYYRIGWKRAKLNGPWGVSTWIIGWANAKPMTMRFDWYLPRFHLAFRHWMMSMGFRRFKDQ